MTRIAIFASGNGSNCENIIRHFRHSQVATVVLVVCNKPDAPVVDRAHHLHVPVEIIPSPRFHQEGYVLTMLREHQVDFIVLAGFLLFIPEELIHTFNHRMINLHPSLLPKYGGKGMWGHHVHEAVKAAGEKETGFTVHWVNTDIDGGEIIAQHKISLLPSDTPDDIAAKEHQLEMQYLPEIIEQLLIKNH